MRPYTAQASRTKKGVLDHNMYYSKIYEYSGDLNSKLVWYSDHGDLFDCQMVWYSDSLDHLSTEIPIVCYPDVSAIQMFAYQIPTVFVIVQFL